MKTSIQMQLAKLPEMSTGELAERYAELFGEPTRRVFLDRDTADVDDHLVLGRYRPHFLRAEVVS